MATREKQPPIQLEEEDVQQEGEGQGPISYAGGGDAPSGGKKGLRVPSLGKRGPALGILQIFIPILAAVVISFLLTNTMAVNKGTYANGIAAVQTSVDTKIAAEDLKISNVINNYASKSEISGFLKATDLSGYATSSALTTLESKVTTLQASVGNQLTQAQIQALITTQLGSTSTYVTKAQMDAAIGQAVIYLKSLIGSSGSSLNSTAYSSGPTFFYLVGPVASGNYTGVKLVFTYPQSSATILGSSSVTTVLTSIASPPVGYTFLPSYTTVGASAYLTGLTVTYTFTSPSPGGTWYVQLPNIDQLGAPLSVVITALQI